jgi:transcriptional regulator with XRE-family HTH domain
MLPVTLSESQARLGKRIRTLRIKQGISQEQFARQCGLHRSHYGEIERGQVNVTLESLLPICEQLGVTVEKLFHRIG